MKEIPQEVGSENREVRNGKQKQKARRRNWGVESGQQTAGSKMRKTKNRGVGNQEGRHEKWEVENKERELRARNRESGIRNY